jgi:hypothetical protein
LSQGASEGNLAGLLNNQGRLPSKCLNPGCRQWVAPASQQVDSSFSETVSGLQCGGMHFRAERCLLGIHLNQQTKIMEGLKIGADIFDAPLPYTFRLP